MTRKSGLGIAGSLLVFVCVLQMTVNKSFAASSLVIKKTIFQNADQVMQEADTEKTRLFAPKTFADAMDLYQLAENDYTNEKSMKDINEKLDKASQLFKQAVIISTEGSILLKDADVARSDAHKLMASKFKPNEWTIAEDTFKRAVSKMERGDKDEAKTLGEEARVLYRQVEKDTVTYSYMSEIMEKLKIIEAMKEGEYYAPKTYQKAVELAKQAQMELEKQPYGNEHAKGLIKQAIAQADYGLKISQRIKAMVKEKKTFEDLFLDSTIQLDAGVATANKF